MNPFLILTILVMIIPTVSDASQKGPIESKYFGSIEIDWEKEVSIGKEIEVNGRKNLFTLMIEPGVEITKGLLHRIDTLEVWDRKSRKIFAKLSQDKDPDGIVNFYIEHHTEQLSSRIIDHFSLKEGLTKEVFLENLQLDGLYIYPSDKELLFALDYSIIREHSNEVLVIIFDSDGVVKRVTSES